MAANYRETNISGASWVRCNRVEVYNPLGGEPFAAFHEERVVSFGDESTTSPIGNAVKKFAPATEISLRNPVTGDLTGQTITHGELYGILFSLYMQTAIERDAEVEASIAFQESERIRMAAEVAAARAAAGLPP